MLPNELLFQVVNTCLKRIQTKDKYGNSINNQILFINLATKLTSNKWQRKKHSSAIQGQIRPLL